MTDTPNPLPESAIANGAYVFYQVNGLRTIGRLCNVDFTARTFCIKPLEWGKPGQPEGPFSFDINTPGHSQEHHNIFYMQIEAITQQQAKDSVKAQNAADKEQRDHLQAQIDSITDRMDARDLRAIALGL